MQMETMLRGSHGMQGEANLMPKNLRRFRKLSPILYRTRPQAKIGQDLRSIIRANYERLPAE
jgi:hypothetical protein